MLIGAEQGIPPEVPYVIGVRDCLVPSINPRTGRRRLFYSVDYTGGELVTHAQSCLYLVGFSEMAKVLLRGEDVHCALAAEINGLSYDAFFKVYNDKKHPEHSAYKKARQAAKPGNFGLPGRMGPARLVITNRAAPPDTPHPSGPTEIWDGNAWVRGYKGTRFCLLIGGADRCGVVKVTEWNRQEIPPTCKACIECAEQIRASWLKRFPENVHYLKQIVPAHEARGWVEQHYSKRIRGGGVDGGSIANGYFQALLADIAGRALCRVTRAQYADPSSVLYGSRGTVFAHDELMGECDEYDEHGEYVAEKIVREIERIMVEEFRKGCPDLAPACKAEAALARRLYKSMEPAYDESLTGCTNRGRLIAWEPKIAA